MLTLLQQFFRERVVVESMFKRSRVAAAKNADGEYDEW